MRGRPRRRSRFMTYPLRSDLIVSADCGAEPLHEKFASWAMGAAMHPSPCKTLMNFQPLLEIVWRGFAPAIINFASAQYVRLRSDGPEQV
jgi:hypothetical protein